MKPGRLLSRDQAFQMVVNDDDAIEQCLSRKAQLVFLMLCTECAVARATVEDTAYRDCYRLLWDCLRFGRAEDVSAQHFENHVMTQDGGAGFLPRSKSDPVNKDFWMFLTNVAGWFAALAAEVQAGHSYFCEVDRPLSLNRVFYAWKLSGELPFLDRRFVAEAFRFIFRHPVGVDAELDYELIKCSFF